MNERKSSLGKVYKRIFEEPRYKLDLIKTKCFQSFLNKQLRSLIKTTFLLMLVECPSKFQIDFNIVIKALEGVEAEYFFI